MRVGDLGNYRNTKEIVRADETHRPWLRWIGYALGTIAFVPTLVATLTVRDLLCFGDDADRLQRTPTVKHETAPLHRLAGTEEFRLDRDKKLLHLREARSWSTPGRGL